MPATYEKIATNTLSSATATVTFSGITGTYTDLIVILNFGAATAGQDLGLRFNGDTSSIYSMARMWGNGTSMATTRTTGGTKIDVDSIGVSTTVTVLDKIQIMNYSNTTTYKTALIRVDDPGKGTEAVIGMWQSNAAITSLDFFMTSGNILSGSSFTLYGIKAA